MTASALVRLQTHGPASTEEVGRRLAACLPAGTTIGLIGPLGSGKTCFVRGLATGLGVDPDEVASPTFVYLVDYDAGTGPDGRAGRLYHADLYRLGDVPAEAAEEVFAGLGLPAAFDGGRLTVVEWWDYYRGPDPSPLVLVEFVIESANDRSILVKFVGPELAHAARTFGAARSATSR